MSCHRAFYVTISYKNYIGKIYSILGISGMDEPGKEPSK
jgi:hypothetical protein